MIASFSSPFSSHFPYASPDGSGAQQVFDGLPEWDLSDLYNGLEDPAIEADFTQSNKDAEAFASDYQGKLVDLLTGQGGDSLAEALKRYEAMQERMGKLISFAGLMYNGNTTDPDRAKFYGDAQERLTAISTQLLFFELELNRVDDALLESSIEGSEALAHYRPWIDDLRKEKPYQLADEIEKLFL